MNSMEKALAALDSAEAINYAATANEFGVHPETLRRHHKGLQQSRQAADFQYKTLLSEQQEIDLLRYIDTLTARGIPPTYQMIWNLGAELTEKEPGKRWAYEFVERHSDRIRSLFLKGEDLSRTKADNEERYGAYFKLVRTLKYQLFIRLI
jgi:hypothetical protein